MIQAMKAREEVRLGALRMIKTALKKHEVDSGKALDEDTEQKVLRMLLKQRRESIAMFEQAGRTELAAKEQAELAVVEAYLPAPAAAAEIVAAVEAAIAETGASSMKQMGQVMKAAQERLAGKLVDGKTLSEKVRARLAG